MGRHVKAAAVAAETIGVVPGPGDRARHLLGHRHEIAAGPIHIGEIDNDGVCAGADDRLGNESALRCAAAKPRAAMDEDVDRQGAAFPHTGGGAGGRTINVEPLILARPVSKALRRAEDAARGLARRRDPPEDQLHVWRVRRLIIGVVERLLVHVAPDQGAACQSCFLHGALSILSPARPRAGGEPALDSRLRGNERSAHYPKFSALKKSLPLSSITTKAGKSTTSMRQIASMPSSGYSMHSTFLMQCSARFAAVPPIEAR